MNVLTRPWYMAAAAATAAAAVAVAAAAAANAHRTNIGTPRGR